MLINQIELNNEKELYKYNLIYSSTGEARSHDKSQLELPHRPRPAGRESP